MSFQEQVKALSKISKAITSDLYLEDILRLIVSVTAELLGSNICSIMLIDAKNQELKIRASQSISEEYNKKPPLKIGEGVAGKAVKENRAIAIRDVTKENEYKHKDIAKRQGLSSLLCVPLAVKGKVIGVINCYTPRLHNFTDTEINILITIASQAAVAIENAELTLKGKEIQEELEVRKIIERAKGLLMHDEGLSEEEAYLRIRKYSMDRRKTMREVAEALILTHELAKKR